MTVENANPAGITLGSKVFFNAPTGTCILYVPVGSKDLYAEADQWSAFTNIKEVDQSGLEEVEISLSAPNGEDVYYDLTGRRVVNPTRGIYIRNGKKVLVR